MGTYQRCQKNKSLQFIAKSFAAGLFLINFSCSSVSKNDSPDLTLTPTPKKLDLTSLGFQLTELGDNQMPAVSQDEKLVAFISKNRRGHKQGQVYIYDLNSLTERRLTFQDGDCQTPAFIHHGQKLVYVSNTDELKESPLLFEKALSTPEAKETTSQSSMELYLSDLSGADIQRLTFRKGFDGNPLPKLDRPQSMIYSVEDKGHLQAWQINTDNLNHVLLIQKNGISIEFLNSSPAGKAWAWIERTQPDSSSISISKGKTLGNKEEKIDLPIGDYRDLSWLDEDRLLFSAKITVKEKVSKYYQIYTYHLANHCLEKVFESNSNLRSPQLMRKNHSLVFASDLSGSYQIYNKALVDPTECSQF